MWLLTPIRVILPHLASGCMTCNLDHWFWMAEQNWKQKLCGQLGILRPALQDVRFGWDNCTKWYAKNAQSHEVYTACKNNRYWSTAWKLHRNIFSCLLKYTSPSCTLTPHCSRKCIFKTKRRFVVQLLYSFCSSDLYNRATSSWCWEEAQKLVYACSLHLVHQSSILLITTTGFKSWLEKLPKDSENFIFRKYWQAAPSELTRTKR